MYAGVKGWLTGGVIAGTTGAAGAGVAAGATKVEVVPYRVRGAGADSRAGAVADGAAGGAAGSGAAGAGAGAATGASATGGGGGGANFFLKKLNIGVWGLQATAGRRQAREFEPLFYQSLLALPGALFDLTSFPLPWRVRCPGRRVGRRLALQ